jgi:SAM-dependent methyltransferase
MTMWPRSTTILSGTRPAPIFLSSAEPFSFLTSSASSCETRAFWRSYRGATVAPILRERDLPLNHLTLLDQSPQMLAHSQEWGPKGARLLIGNACRTELPTASFDMIVSALGDPYNCVTFWQEVVRLLKSGGACLYTTPAPEWATRFRGPGFRSHAEFAIADGTTLLVPSHIPTLDQQIRMITDAGLHVIEVGSLSAEQLLGVHSPKLLVDDATRLLPIVRGFVARRI